MGGHQKIFFVFIIVISIVFTNSFNEQNIGLLLTYTLVLSNSIYNFLYGIGDLENSMVSVERCLGYTDILSEAPLEMELDKQLENQNWPGEGLIKFENYSVNYRSDTPLVLKNLNL